MLSKSLFFSIAAAAAFALTSCGGGGASSQSPSRTAGTETSINAISAGLRTADAAIQAADAALNVAPEGTSRTTAQTALDAAQDFKTALQAVAREASEAALTAASNAARTALAAAQAAYDAAPEGASRTAAQAALTAAQALVQAQTAIIDAQEAPAATNGGAMTVGTTEGWSGLSYVVATDPPSLRSTVPPTVAVERSLRAAVGSDASATPLRAEDILPVPYEAGKIVMALGQESSGDQLRMRGLPVPYYSNNANAFSYQDFTRFGASAPAPKTVAGLAIGSSGLAVNIGGRWVDGLDFRMDLNRVVSPIAFVGENPLDGYDLALDFGRPSASPEGNAEHYWVHSLLPTSAQVDANSDFREDDQVLPLGTYHVRLSNHIGLDDDVNFYLSYAAYGFMDFASRTFSARSLLSFDRAFPFHVGYDAFEDEASKRTADIAPANRITGGTFKGRTIAVQLVLEGGRDSTVGIILPGTDRRLPATIGAGTRLRGDIELTATISGTASGNTISGKIKNLESFNAGDWESFAAIPGEVGLASSAITPSGSFSGATATVPGFGVGGYQGHFYGPHDSLEAAGVWYLQAEDSQQFPPRYTHNPILGSFGAALVRADGTYGAGLSPSPPNDFVGSAVANRESGTADAGAAAVAGGGG